MKSDITEALDLPKKPRLEKPETRSSPITVQTSKDLAMADLSSFEETSADDFAMEMGLACVVCRWVVPCCRFFCFFVQNKQLKKIGPIVGCFFFVFIIWRQVGDK